MVFFFLLLLLLLLQDSDHSENNIMYKVQELCHKVSSSIGIYFCCRNLIT
jgi:hypothetical protein